MKTQWLISIVAVAGLSLLAGCSPAGGLLIRPVPVDQTLEETTVQSDGGVWLNKIAIVDISGLIVNARIGSLFVEGENPVSLLAEKLQAAKDPRVKAVILRINSPGGTVQASEVMHGMVMRFRRETGKPVLSYITDMGASGGYYVACAGQSIACQPTSIAGSIGVIIQSISFAGTMQKIGLTADAIVSGPFKTMGSPLATMPAEHRQVFQTMVTEFYNGFVKVVAAGRPKLTEDKVRVLADGRVYTGTQALANGLVDKNCDLTEIIADAKRAAGINRARVVLYHRPLGYVGTAYAAAPGATPQVNLINIEVSEFMFMQRPTFLYLWTAEAK